MKNTSHKRVPRILKINRVEKKKLRISALFNTGENRILDFNHILKNIWKVKKSDFAYPLLNPDVFAKVSMGPYTIEWKNVRWRMKNLQGKMAWTWLDLAGDTLYELSEPDVEMEFSIGEIFKKARLAAKLTQDQVAKLAGTSRTYITKIENGTQDIELMTLKKLVEAGLNKQLRISIW